MIICADMLFLAVISVKVLVACSACSDRYFLNENKECIACPEHCVFCDSKKHCLSCENGFWGNICELSCINCMAETSCEKTNGVCQNECKYGYSGILCNIRCDTKCLHCNREHSNMCVQCAPGRYPSVSCNETCSGCHEQNCDETGLCLLRCVNSSWGERCERKCPQFCKYASCHRDNGTCSLGCNDDFIGLHCNGTGTDSRVNDTNSTAVIPIVVIITVIVLVGALIALFFCKRARKKSRKDFKLEDTQEAVSFVNHSEERTTKTREEQKTDDKNKKMTTIATTGKPQPKTGSQKLQEFVDHVGALTDEDYREYFLRLTASLSVIEITKNRQNGPDSPGDDEKVLYQKTVTVEVGAKKEVFENASFIQDRESYASEYIAYKGQTGQKSDISRFWRMIWDLDCKLIVTLNTCEEETDIQNYLPTKDHPVKFNPLFLKLRDDGAIETVHFITRNIEIKEGTQVKSATQLQFKDWPEKGFVENVQSLLKFRDAVKKAKNGSSPLVVLDSAGRTGTFIAVDMLLNKVDGLVQSEGFDKLDIDDCVKNLREQGLNAIENLEYFKFIHLVISHYIGEKLRDKNGK